MMAKKKRVNKISKKSYGGGVKPNPEGNREERRAAGPYPEGNCYCGGPEEIYPHAYGTGYYCSERKP